MAPASGAHRRVGFFQNERMLIQMLVGIPLGFDFWNCALVFTALWGLAPGTEIRPMGLALWMALFGLAAAVSGAPLAIACLARAPRTGKLLCAEAFCFLASLNSFFVGKALFDFIVSYHRLVLSK